jgi:hypothetical protein
VNWLLIACPNFGGAVLFLYKQFRVPKLLGWERRLKACQLLLSCTKKQMIYWGKHSKNISSKSWVAKKSALDIRPGITYNWDTGMIL